MSQLTFQQAVQKEILTVSEFNTVIKSALQELGVFSVKGEITEMNISQRKGVNITLSDGKANIRIGGYAPTVKGIDLVEIGMDVVVEGTADLYVPYGSFSLSIHAIEPVGEGSLAIAYQKLKEKLESEGLFAVEHKQALPLYVTKIALITGKDSAAYSDFIKILRENNVGIEVLYYPALVQGKRAVKSISKALQRINNQDVDAIVLTRGGGSLEDLKAFNDEELAQLIFSSPCPVIAGVGHEKDESIADFVADIRASTPSQAAYYIVQQNQNFIETITLLGDKMYEKIKENITTESQNLETAESDINHSINQIIDTYRIRIENIERILSSFDVKKVLQRGFAIIKKGSKQIRSITEIATKDTISTTLKDGVITSSVTNITN